jgi:hypothetical protein
VFCPNCGTQNPDAAQTCSKCNFHLKSVAAPKFKGTMLMMNQPAVAPSAPPPRGPAPRPGLPLAGASLPSVPSKLKGTMMGVAPVAGLTPAPPALGSPQPAGQQPMGQTVVGTGPLTPPPHPTGPPPAADRGWGGPDATVNPLGGTVTADPRGFPGPSRPPSGGPSYGGSPRPPSTAPAGRPPSALVAQPGLGPPLDDGSGMKMAYPPPATGFGVLPGSPPGSALPTFVLPIALTFGGAILSLLLWILSGAILGGAALLVTLIGAAVSFVLAQRRTRLLP